MIHLVRGDSLPIVGACQLLLNDKLPESKSIAVDGIFGPQTEAAVRYFNDIYGLASSDYGTNVIGPGTWAALSDGRFRVYDLLDIFDPALYHSLDHLRSVGAEPALVGGACGTAYTIGSRLNGAGIEKGSLVLLRFMGHGNRGHQVLSYGTGWHIRATLRGEPITAYDEIDRGGPTLRDEENSMRHVIAGASLSNNSLNNADIARSLQSISPLFAPFGSVEFHGCQVGGGAIGARFLRRVADLLGVPAVGARGRQWTSNAVRYHGHIRTQAPRGVRLKEWAQSLRSRGGIGI